jgi:hypothetical protein
MLRGARYDLTPLEAMDAIGFISPGHGSGRNVPLPSTQPGQPLGFLEKLLPPLQGFFGDLVLGDVLKRGVDLV